MKFEYVGRNGALTRIMITGTELELRQIVEAGITSRILSSDVRDGVLKASVNRREAERIEAFVAALETQEVREERSSGRRRRVELLAVAERQKLSHGTSWVCNGWQVDRDSLPPEFEGELVCYVYED